MTQAPYVSKDGEMLAKLVLMADTRVQAQLSAGLAADQRAMVFAGLIAVAAAALGSAAVEALTATPPQVDIGHLALWAAAGMVVAMSLAVYAARPVKWFYAGSDPLDWRTDLAADKAWPDTLPSLLLDYESRITNNEATMKGNGRWLAASSLVALGTLILSGIALVSMVA